MSKNTLGKAIRANRRRAKMSLQDIASAAGLSKSYVWELESGKPGATNPSVKTVYDLATALGIEPTIMAIWAMADLREKTA